MAYSNPEDETHYQRQYQRKRYAEDEGWRGARKSTWLQVKYGITLEEWNIQFEKQNKCCAICKAVYHGCRGWHTDHCHITGKFRGILCQRCNARVLPVLENKELVEAALTYLKETS